MMRETDYFSITFCLNRLTSPMKTSPKKNEKATSAIHLENDKNTEDESTKVK